MAPHSETVRPLSHPAKFGKIAQGGMDAAGVPKPVPASTKVLQRLLARHEIPLSRTSRLQLKHK